MDAAAAPQYGGCTNCRHLQISGVSRAMNDSSARTTTTTSTTKALPRVSNPSCPPKRGAPHRPDRQAAVSAETRRRLVYVCLLQAKALFSFEKHLPTPNPTSSTISPPPHVRVIGIAYPTYLRALLVPDMTGSSPYRRSWLSGHITPGFTRRRNGVSPRLFPERPPACQCLFPRRGTVVSISISHRKVEETSCLVRDTSHPREDDERQTPRHPSSSPRCFESMPYHRRIPAHPAASRSPRQLVEPPRRQSQIPPQLDHRRHRGNDRSSHLRFYTSQPRGSVAPRCRRQSRRYEGVAVPTTCVKCGGAIRAQHRNHPYKAGPSHKI